MPHLFTLIYFHLQILSLTFAVSVRIGTCNLWNVMFNWKTRTKHIADIISENDIDIMVFQEVRMTGEATNFPASQIDSMKSLLPQHKWIVAKPAGLASQPERAYLQGWMKEGLGIVSRLQIVSTNSMNLTKTGSPDKNYRIALHVTVRTGPEITDMLNIIVVHFSYHRQQQCENAEDVLRRISDEQLENVIVLGDFNAYSDFSGPVDLFTTKRHTSCSASLKNSHYSALGSFKDAWLSLGKQSSEGLTFSNMPTPGLQSRPDRILVSKGFKIVDIARSGDGTDYKKYYNRSVIISRAKAVIGAAYDAIRGRAGYSCPHDCGPNGSCRCGVCITGGNELNCDTQNCSECTSYKFVLFLVMILPLLIAIATLFFAVLKILVVSANFSQDDILDILGYRCCLFNKQLFKFRFMPRRYKSTMSEMFILCQLPPLLLLLLMLIFIVWVLVLFSFVFQDGILLVYSILPEELFPSDHLILHAHLSL